MKFLLLLALGVIAWRMISGRWIWETLGLGMPLSADGRARALLGVKEDATHGEIVDAHRKLIAKVHPDRGGSAEQVYEANAARDLLLARLADRQERK